MLQSDSRIIQVVSTSQRVVRCVHSRLRIPLACHWVRCPMSFCPGLLLKHISVVCSFFCVCSCSLLLSFVFCSFDTFSFVIFPRVGCCVQSIVLLRGRITPVVVAWRWMTRQARCVCGFASPPARSRSRRHRCRMISVTLFEALVIRYWRHLLHKQVCD